MAAGDVYNKSDADVDAAETFDMQPSAGTEVVVHNITINTAAASDTCALEYYDGTTAFVSETKTGSGSWMGMFLHCTNGAYYRVNPANADTKICCDGMYTK